MFPFRDHNPSRRTPYVTWGLIALNIIIFALYSPLLGDDVALSQFFDEWAMVPREIVSGYAPQTLVTSMFLHAGLMHLGGNMLFLWIYGDNIEDTLGHVMFLAFYLACGLAAGVAHIIADTGSNIPTVGASGAIAGVMGAYLLLFPKAKIDIAVIFIVFFKVFTLPAFVVLGIWMGLQLFSGLGSTGAGGGVAYWAHIGGFIAGIVFILPWWLRHGAKQYWKKTDYHPPNEPTFNTRTTNIPTVRRNR